METERGRAARIAGHAILLLLDNNPSARPLAEIHAFADRYRVSRYYLGQVAARDLARAVNMTPDDYRAATGEEYPYYPVCS